MIPEWMDLVIWGHEHECQVRCGHSLSLTETRSCRERGKERARDKRLGAALCVRPALLPGGAEA